MGLPFCIDAQVRDGPLLDACVYTIYTHMLIQNLGPWDRNLGQQNGRGMHHFDMMQRNIIYVLKCLMVQPSLDVRIS